MRVTLCPTCGTGRHVECCARCGALVPSRRRSTGYCTARCAREQAREDAISAELEPTS